ncbi:MAG TPA: Rid family detoxifying hydrolase [Vicinamibacterales bacterium]|nr:Rid family detoxifying hydrolase [Vicinamibacterales bacterium]
MSARQPKPSSPADAPAPCGHYSHAVACDGLIFVSGQLPVDPGTSQALAGRPIEVQTRQALENMDAALRAAGSRRDLVLKTTIFLTDVALWDRVNTAYGEFFGGHRPARSIVPTGPLHLGADIEIEAIAVLP